MFIKCTTFLGYYSKIIQKKVHPKILIVAKKDRMFRNPSTDYEANSQFVSNVNLNSCTKNNQPHDH